MVTDRDPDLDAAAANTLRDVLTQFEAGRQTGRAEVTAAVERLVADWDGKNIRDDIDTATEVELMCAEQLRAALTDPAAALAAHDADIREQVAREIEVEMRRHDGAQVGFSALGDAYAHAARIARGGAA